MKSLVERLNQASDSYYNGKGELMTDYEWDALFDQLKRLEEETGEILPDSRRIPSGQYTTSSSRP